ncbi:ERF superfamily protein [Megasphaera elsdenii]|uniref:ERF superfamily protein n=2 Tax=Megasphaera elsdenii TaxID=907 RepID=A0A2S0MAE8_MEGEL|nr:ERF superfamily protein [Megasphaera elsdenii]
MIVQALLKAPKSQYNKFGKYAYRSCEDIVEAAKPLLGEQGLTLLMSDDVVLIGDRYYIKATATLIDANDGEQVAASALAREPVSRKGMDDSQVTGSSSSYARKYALNGLFCIDDSKDSDQLNTDAPSAENDSVPAGVPQTVREYFQLVTDWARQNGATAFILPLVKEKYGKSRFSELTLPEAKAFYEQFNVWVKAAMAKDDAALMEGV